MLKLNLGCGLRRLEGYVNVDKAGDPEVSCDLEVIPWPWATSSVEEVLFIHVLEHLGATPEAFIGIMKELYRVCAPGARVRIQVPHPRHNHFLDDPTHVRVITPAVLSLFSKANCALWAEKGKANTPLAVYHDIDFEIEEHQIVLEPRILERLRAGELSTPQLEELLAERNNIASEIHIVLRAVKPAAA